MNFNVFFSGTSNLLTNRHLRNVLIAKEYKHRYVEYEGGHDFIHWGDSLERGLLYFYGFETFNGANENTNEI